jgi:hypothetical protein
LTFELKVEPDVNFKFNTIESYTGGIIRANAVTLYVKSVAGGGFGGEWDLYVQSNTVAPPNWDDVIFYSSTGNIPQVDMLQLKIRNIDNTPNNLNFFSLQSTPTYIIGSAANDPAVACAVNQHTNVAGDYLTSPQCYKFYIDFMIKPGINNNLRCGYYKLRVDFILMEDL